MGVMQHIQKHKRHIGSVKKFVSMVENNSFLVRIGI